MNTNNPFSNSFGHLEQSDRQWNRNLNHGYILWPSTMQRTTHAARGNHGPNIFIGGSARVDWRSNRHRQFSHVVSQGNRTTGFGTALDRWRTAAEAQHQRAIDAQMTWNNDAAFRRRQEEMEERLRRWHMEEEQLQQRQEREARDALVLRPELFRTAGLVDGFFPLLQLPTEVLALAIDQVLAEQHALGIVEVRRRGVLTSVFRTTSVVREVAIWRLLQGFTFVISDEGRLQSFRNWLHELVELYGARLNKHDAWWHVRSLAFPLFDYFESMPRNTVSPEMKLMEQCPNLTHVSIHFRVKLLNRCNQYGDQYNRSLAKLRHTHNLWLLLKLKKLKSIHLNVTTNKSFGFDAILPLFRIQKWLQEQFDAQHERKERPDPVEIKVFSFGGRRGSDAWREVRRAARDRIDVVRTCDARIRWPLIPCVGFVHSD